MSMQIAQWIAEAADCAAAGDWEGYDAAMSAAGVYDDTAE